MKIIAKIIWDISEGFYIPLGEYAPIIFEYMIGFRGNKKKIE